MNETVYSIASLESDAEAAAQRAVLHGCEQPVPSYLEGEAREIWMRRYQLRLLWESAGRMQGEAV